MRVTQAINNIYKLISFLNYYEILAYISLYENSSLVWFIVRPCQHDNGYIDRFKSTPTNGPRFTAPSLPRWSPIQVLTEVDVP